MEIILPTEGNIKRAAVAIMNGDLVGMPTETVYGLAANAWDRTALARVFEAKRRPHFDPLIVHISSSADARTVADLEALGQLRPSVCRLMDAFWPGPLTLILPKRPSVPDLATSGLPTVAVRVPSHPVALRLIELSSGAIAAPSANPFGYLSPTTAAHVAEQLGDSVAVVLDAGKCGIGVESTVLDVTVEPFMVLRPGGLPVEALRNVVPGIVVFDRSTLSPRAPGQLPSHYAPAKPLFLHERGSIASVPPDSRAACLVFSREDAERAAPGFASVRWLSAEGDSCEAAANLFEILHDLDASGIAAIHAEKVPASGLGAAVNDRLYKASRKGP